MLFIPILLLQSPGFVGGVVNYTESERSTDFLLRSGSCQSGGRVSLTLKVEQRPAPVFQHLCSKVASSSKAKGWGGGGE